jgi:hypothetical protein
VAAEDTFGGEEVKEASLEEEVASKTGEEGKGEEEVEFKGGRTKIELGTETVEVGFVKDC